EAPGGRARRDRAGARDRAHHGGRDQGCGGRRCDQPQDWGHGRDECQHRDRRDRGMTTSDATARPGELVVVTGMTGAGRSTAAKELEDLGFYVIDNLPPELVSSVVRLVDEKQGLDQPVAVVVDVRAGV